MKVVVSQSPLRETVVDLLVVGLFEGEGEPDGIGIVPGASKAKGSFKKLTRFHLDDPQWLLVVGLGKREDADAERLRVAAALAAKEAGRLEASSIAWALPDTGDADAAAEALVTGTILGAYRFDRFKGKGAAEDDAPPPSVESLTLLGPEGIAAAAETARVYAEAQNRARDLQSTPANFATPSFLAARAEEIAAGHEAVTVDVLGPRADRRQGHGRAGRRQPRRRRAGPADRPALLRRRLRPDPRPGRQGRHLRHRRDLAEARCRHAGDEVRHVRGGRGAGGGGGDRRARPRRRLVAVVPSTENMPSGTAIKPGDVITQYNGKTVEVNNTDAEGRLILADALAYAVELGAERLVDLATLTGAVVIALGSTYAAVVANDDELAAAVSRAGEESGELTWRLPLHPEFKALMKGTVADLSNLASKRKAGTITAASFLEEFVGETPWAHIDIAGTAWEVGREYTGNDASGFGVRLLVELARAQSAA